MTKHRSVTSGGRPLELKLGIQPAITAGINTADQLADADERTNSAWTQKVRCVIGSITGASAMLVIEGGELPAQKLN
jgi:hypothetical protein